MNKLAMYLISMLFFLGCNPQYDGLLVKDKDGNVYKLKFNVGATYHIEKLDIKQLKQLEEGD